MYYLAPLGRRLTLLYKRIHTKLQPGGPFGRVQYLGPNGASIHCHLEL